MICPFNIYPNGQFSVYTSKEQLRMRSDTPREGRRGGNTEMLDKNREVLSPSVPSRCWHSSFAPYQAAYVRLPSPSIHPCSSVPSRHAGTEDGNTLPEKLCQEEKVEKLLEMRQIKQREEGNRTFSALLLSAERIHRSG